MRYDKLKKGMISLALAGSFVVGVGATSTAQAQDWRRENRRERIEDRRERIENRLDRIREREMLDRIRRMDRNRELRYRYNGATRLVGYYDRWGRFHAVGYYDRFGRFYRY
jgi:hypothetical protein